MYGIVGIIVVVVVLLYGGGGLLYMHMPMPPLYSPFSH